MLQSCLMADFPPGADLQHQENLACRKCRHRRPCQGLVLSTARMQVGVVPLKTCKSLSQHSPAPFLPFSYRRNRFHSCLETLRHGVPTPGGYVQPGIRGTEQSPPITYISFLMVMVPCVLAAEAAGEGRGWKYCRWVLSLFLFQEKAAATRQRRGKHRVLWTCSEETAGLPGTEGT